MYLNQKSREIYGRNKNCIGPLFCLGFFFPPSALSCLPSGFSTAWWCLPKLSALLQSFSHKLCGCPGVFSPLPSASLEVAVPVSEVEEWKLSEHCLVQACWSCMSGTSFSFHQLLKSQQVNKHLQTQRQANMLKWPSGDCCVFGRICTLQGLYQCS